MKLSREQFGLPWLSALRAAYYVTRASIAFAPMDNDVESTRRYLAKFYGEAAARHGGSGSSAELAGLELRYWIVHRELAGDPDKTAMIQALARLHAAVFGISEEAALPSARHRSAAAQTVDRITSNNSEDVEADWRRIRKQLTQAYSEVRRALEEASG